MATIVIVVIAVIVVATVYRGLVGLRQQYSRSKEVKELARNAESIEIDGARFPVTSELGDLVTSFHTKKKVPGGSVMYGNRCTLVMDSRDVTSTMLDAVRRLGKDDFRTLLMYSQLVCFECHGEYSDLCLQGWGDTGVRCPSCENGYVLLVFDIPEEITDADVPGIRAQFLSQTRLWWTTHSNNADECYKCKALVRRDGGCLYGMHFHCEKCMDRYVLPEALRNLQWYGANYVGKGFVRKARHLVAAPRPQRKKRRS